MVKIFIILISPSTCCSDGLGDWSSNGCRLVRDNATEDSVTCECNHLTNFALLLVRDIPVI